MSLQKAQIWRKARLKSEQLSREENHLREFEVLRCQWAQENARWTSSEEKTARAMDNGLLEDDGNDMIGSKSQEQHTYDIDKKQQHINIYIYT